jgi:protein SMG5
MSTIEVSNFNNESKYRKTYRAVLEISKNLDSIYKSSNAFLKIFQPETTLLRDRLKQYSETLIFRQPIEYGRKVEEILWRRVFYDIIHIVKLNKKSLKLNKELEYMYRLHLSTAFGFYNQLILRLKQEFNSTLNLDSFLDFSLQSRDISSALFPLATNLKCDSVSLKDFITKILHKFLLCLGDLTRYQIDFDPIGCTKLSEKYYFMSLMLIPEHGMPLNQLGTLYLSQNYGCDSAFYYIYCLSCMHSFSGSKENLKLLFIKNRKRYEDLKYKKYDINDTKDADDLRELNAKRIKKFIVSFLYLIEMFLSGIIETTKVPVNINNLQELCQLCLQDFNICMYFNDELKNNNDRLTYLPNDLVFKLMLMSLMTIERLKRHRNFNNQKTSATKNTILFTAIAFAFLLFSHILNHAITRFEKDILNLTHNQEIIQEKHDDGIKKILVTKDSDSEELSEDEKMKKIHFLFSRRRRRRNSDSDSESDDSNDSLKYSNRQSKSKKNTIMNKDEDFSEDNLSDLSEYNVHQRSEEESAMSEIEKDDESVRETTKKEGFRDYLSKIIPLNNELNNQINPLSTNFREFSLQLSSTYLNYENDSQKSFDESSDFIDNELYKRVLAGKAKVSVPPGFETNEIEAKVIEEIGEKIAKFQIETDTEISTALSESDDSKSEASVIERTHHL